ncbi:hypothetical protein EVAR_60023_1 [Eumeta japonica]|uniref:Uncharacterized protein n=1 Tax=Eumeta variegata TaxID=151549 RepID=A0A4C1ZJT6_EUMVA|nr:hypothetical protein EVAR_60023_1 [Eumeta japonica]
MSTRDVKVQVREVIECPDFVEKSAKGGGGYKETFCIKGCSDAARCPDARYRQRSNGPNRKDANLVGPVRPAEAEQTKPPKVVIEAESAGIAAGVGRNTDDGAFTSLEAVEGFARGDHIDSKCEPRSERESPKCIKWFKAACTGTAHGAFSSEYGVRHKWNDRAQSQRAYY